MKRPSGLLVFGREGRRQINGSRLPGFSWVLSIVVLRKPRPVVQGGSISQRPGRLCGFGFCMARPLGDFFLVVCLDVKEEGARIACRIHALVNYPKSLN
jgi:hypothetical protein